jgi:hypothetical protein
MNASGQEPAPAPQRRPVLVVTAPVADKDAPKSATTAATVERPHDDHVDEPGYGHGV